MKKKKTDDRRKTTNDTKRQMRVTVIAIIRLASRPFDNWAKKDGDKYLVSIHTRSSLTIIKLLVQHKMAP